MLGLKEGLYRNSDDRFFHMLLLQSGAYPEGTSRYYRLFVLGHECHAQEFGPGFTVAAVYAVDIPWFPSRTVKDRPFCSSTNSTSGHHEESAQRGKQSSRSAALPQHTG